MLVVFSGWGGCSGYDMFFYISIYKCCVIGAFVILFIFSFSFSFSFEIVGALIMTFHAMPVLCAIHYSYNTVQAFVIVL